MGTTIDGDQLKALIREIKLAVGTKVFKTQGGVPTFFDNLVLERATLLSNATPDSSTFEELLNFICGYREFTSRGRFQNYSQRVQATSAGWLSWSSCPLHFSASQGVHECLSWRGLPLFKTAFDFALYPMLVGELRPQTVIELGSGSGASALWLADLLRLNGIGGRVYSIDVHKPKLKDPHVEFIQGDSAAIDLVFAEPQLNAFPHPWMIIEDAHVNTIGVLRFFGDRTAKGDYILVEDSRPKTSALQDFDREYGEVFSVDSRYTDFFGRNCTCCVDSIFVRVSDAHRTIDLAPR